MENNWKIYFIRHWQTNRNLINQMNPWDVDSELNETWLKQALEAWKKAKKDWMIFDIIISSPLKRALNTAEIIWRETWYEWEILTDDRLKEQFAWVFKDYNHDQLEKEFNAPETEKRRIIFKSKKYNKKEDIIEFYNRVTEIYKEIENKYSWKKVLIVWHTGVSRILFINSQDIDFYTAVYQMKSTPNWIIIDLSKKIEKV